MEPGTGQQEDWKHSRQYSASIITVTVWDLQETLAGHVPLGLSFLIQNYTEVWCHLRKLTIRMSRQTGSKSPKLRETPGTVSSSVSAGVVLIQEGGLSLPTLPLTHSLAGSGDCEPTSS